MLRQVVEELDGEGVVAAGEQLHPPRREPPPGGRPADAVLLARPPLGQPDGGEGVEVPPHAHPAYAQLVGQLGHGDPGVLAEQQDQPTPSRHVIRGYRSHHRRPEVAAVTNSPGRSVAAMHRLERLINLVAALLDSERPLTIEELRSRLPGYAESDGAFRRAFERDKEALRELGVPSVLEPLDPAYPSVEGYRIPKESYYLSDPGLVPDELAALHLAASAVRMEGANGVEALWKLGGELAEEGPAPAVAALRRRPPGPAVRGHLRPPAGDVHLPRPAAPRRPAPPLVPHRPLVPVGLRPRRRRGPPVPPGPRRVRRVGGRAGGHLPAAARGVDRGPAVGDGRRRPVTARLLVDADQAGWAVGHVGADAVDERRDDGSVVLAIRVTNRPAFRSFVLGFLDHAEVLGPPELRDDMVSWLEAQCPS